MPFGNNCVCNRQNCSCFAHAITLPIAHAIIPKSHSNPCDYPYKLSIHTCMTHTHTHAHTHTHCSPLQPLPPAHTCTHTHTAPPSNRSHLQELKPLRQEIAAQNEITTIMKDGLKEHEKHHETTPTPLKAMYVCTASSSTNECTSHLVGKASIRVLLSFLSVLYVVCSKYRI